jgi:hypothetical protein
MVLEKSKLQESVIKCTYTEKKVSFVCLFFSRVELGGRKVYTKHLVTFTTFQLSTTVKLMSHSFCFEYDGERSHFKAATLGALKLSLFVT